ncbi:hypothetical protein EJB05_18448, partial [Eragrostis curvula]
MENGAERHEASRRVFPRATVSPPPPATASRALIHRSSPFRPSQMEPKKSSAQHQPRAMEPKGKKSSSRGTAAAAEAESPLSCLFNPPAQEVTGKDEDLYRILYKGQSGSRQAGMADGKSQWGPPKSRAAYNKDGKHSPPYDSVDTSCFGSSVNYGGRDYYGSSTAMQTAEASNETDKKDPGADSHGDWWQGKARFTTSECGGLSPGELGK